MADLGVDMFLVTWDKNRVADGPMQAILDELQARGFDRSAYTVTVGEDGVAVLETPSDSGPVSVPLASADLVRQSIAEVRGEIPAAPKPAGPGSQGVVALATPAQVEAGAADVVVTPAHLKAAIAAIPAPPAGGSGGGLTATPDGEGGIRLSTTSSTVLTSDGAGGVVIKI